MINSAWTTVRFFPWIYNICKIYVFFRRSSPWRDRLF